jgi:glycosyltransferase involved in cell wall biosynthesis
VKVLVINNMTPFVWGGAEELAHNLVKNLNITAGVRAELLRLPFTWDPAERLLQEIFICRTLQIENADRVIGLKFPAYLVQHPHKTLWLLHQFRQAYDMWTSGLSNIPATLRGDHIRSVITSTDNKCFAECRKIYTISAVTQERLDRYNGVPSEVLWYPLNDPENFVNAGYGDYIFAGGRINGGKRQHLLVEAMRHVKSPVQLIVGGPADTEQDAQRLRDLVGRYDLAGKVILDIDFLERAKLARYVCNALACAYVPLDEDAFGYVTMEAFHAGKAMLTTEDAGGLLLIVRDGDTGMVTPPDAQALAAAIDRLAANRSETMRLGAAARDSWMNKRITWPDTIERLLG